MIVDTSESRVLYDEYQKVFKDIDRKDQNLLLLENQALGILKELQYMDAVSKKIEAEGKIDKIENFNEKFVGLKLRLNNIYREIYG